MQIMMIAVLDFSGFKSTVTALVNISKATFLCAGMCFYNGPLPSRSLQTAPHYIGRTLSHVMRHDHVFLNWFLNYIVES